METTSNIEWHYANDGERFGPVSEASILELIRQNQITEQTSVWNSAMQDWQPILSTCFATVLRNPNSPPPLTGETDSNTVVWVLAFVPLIGNIIQNIISGMAGVPNGNLWFVTLLINIILSSIDERKLKAAGHNTKLMGSAWLIPVYLFKRAKVLKQSNAYFIVWCILFVLMLFV